MKKITIQLWQRIPYQPDEEPGMPTYRIAGTITGLSSVVQRVFICDVSMEIDGRDGEVEHIAGVDLNKDDDMWESLQQAIAENEGLVAEMKKVSDEFYAQA